MKSLILAAALLTGSAAIAQETPAAHPVALPHPEATDLLIQPDNSNPERDARGIVVISDPATAPVGFNQPPAVGGPLVDASQRPMPGPATESYKACSRTVTDNCVQTYERGRSPQG